MGIILYPSYKVDIMATSIIVSIELVSLYMYSIYLTKLTYIQLEHSAIKATISKQIANILRIFCSFISSPYCTSIGLAVSVVKFKEKYSKRKEEKEDTIYVVSTDIKMKNNKIRIYRESSRSNK